MLVWTWSDIQLRYEITYRCSVARGVAVDNVGCHGRLMQHNRTTRAIVDSIKQPAPDQVRSLDRRTVRELDTSIMTKRCGEVPSRGLFSLLSKEEDVVFYMSEIRIWKFP